jgi:hypothetical protein
MQSLGRDSTTISKAAGYLGGERASLRFAIFPAALGQRGMGSYGVRTRVTASVRDLTPSRE